MLLTKSCRDGDLVGHDVHGDHGQELHGGEISANGLMQTPFKLLLILI